MASNLHLTFSCGDFDRARPLIDGSVRAEGIDLEVIVVPPSERHDRMTQHLEFDACEYSLATYLPARERGLPITAIPIFPHRCFRHASIFIHEKSDLRSPKDFADRCIGVPHYTNSAGVWMRGILTHEYGVDLSGCKWITEREDEVPGWEPPSGVQVESWRHKGGLVSLFEQGELDVLFYPSVPRPVALRKPGFGRFFPNYVAEEKTYYQRTQIFPIMHTVVIKDEILAMNPWVALSLTKAWAEAKQRIHAYLVRQYSSLIWYADYWREQQALFGDPWAYGVKSNRHVIEQLINFELEQGILKKRPRVEDLFAPNTVGWGEEDPTSPTISNPSMG